jgi:hypothetical protein
MRRFLFATFCVCLSSISLHIKAQKIDNNVVKTIESFYKKENVYYSSHPGKIKPGFKKFKIRNKTIVVYGTDYSIRSVDAKQYVEMESQVNKLEPTLILTEGYFPALADKRQTVSLYGESGFLRYVGKEKGVEVNLWDTYWGHIYYELLKKYKSEDIFMSLMCYLLNYYRSNSEAEFENFYKLMTLNAFESQGYPVSNRQKKVEYFINSWQYK